MFTSPGQQDLAKAMTRVKALADSERIQEIDKLEQIWDGSVYRAEGRPSFWDNTVPLQTRAPCIKDPVVRIAGNRLASLVFGEHSFPKIAPVAGDVGAPGLQVSTEDATQLADAITHIIEKTQLRLKMRQLMRDGLRSRSGVTVCTIQGGELQIDTLPAKWCTPKFDKQNPKRVVSLDYRYRYETDGKHFWYRRLLTESEDAVWRDVPADDEGKEPEWASWPHEVIALEFCPVDWHPNLKDTTCHREYDGVALADGLSEETEALDLSRSMRHRNALYNGDPTAFVSGAKPADVTAERGSEFSGSSPRNRGNQGQIWGGGAAIKKGPAAVIWTEKEQARMSLVESTGAGAAGLDKNTDEVRGVLLDAMQVVLTNPEKLGSGDMSARALTILFRAMLDHGDNLRECWGDSLVRILSTLLRLAASRAAEVDGLYLPGIDALRPILRRFNLVLRGGATRWISPPLKLTWGPWFDDSPGDVQAGITAASTAVGGKPVLSTRTAVQLASRWAPVTNVDAEVAGILKETQQAADAAGSMLGSLGGAPKPEPPPPPPPPSATPTPPEETP